MNSIISNTTGHLVTLFEKHQGQLSSFAQLRREAINSFSKQGIPSRKNEEYKYTPADKLFSENVQVVVSAPAVKISKTDVASWYIPELKENTIVLINGFYNAELSSIKFKSDKTILCSLSEAFEKHPSITEKHFSKYADLSTDAFIALNTAFFTDGLFIYVPDGVVEETPFHIINITAKENNELLNPRHLFIAGKNSSVKLVETTVTIGDNADTVVNSLHELVVGENARMEYYKLQNYTDQEKQVNTVQVYQSLNSYFNTNTITLNASWLRNNLNIVLDAQNCETHLNGLFITNGNQHVDNHTLVDHRKPNCQSNQLYKGILKDKSVGVFNGKIFVRPDAQKTNAYQSSKNILLSDNATINTKPQLEIYADDVKCSHGSSTGHIDPEALFYLQSRGLSVDSAKQLLMFAFAGDVINTIPLEPLKEYVTDLVSKKLG